MVSIKTIYVCSNCGETTPKWIGKCPSCSEWNSFVEDAVDKKTYDQIDAQAREVINLDLRKTTAKDRLQTGITEFDRVTGGGLVADSFTLLSGDPGIGKSTLALQVAGKMAEAGKKVLYISGEESASQISMRASRLGITSKNLQMLSENLLDVILATIAKQKPEFVVADSAQVFSSPAVSGTAGNIAQTRHTAEEFMKYAKMHATPIILIGHVNKTGDLAGPKVLEHLVDTVLYLEGDRYQQFRILHANKNRFGSTNEIGVFEMDGSGLAEVTNPSKAFLEGRKKNAIGSVITCTVEGTRPFLVEVQALTSRASFSYPRRNASGFDLNRLQLLIAVLNKHAGIRLDDQDVYINVTGGFRVQEPSSDLAIATAIASSKRGKPLPSDTVVFGEIGLAGELRPVPKLDQRLEEAFRLGFKQVVLPKQGKKPASKIKLVEITDIGEIIKFL
jgi:DNA repair protein RadA/Sms